MSETKRPWTLPPLPEFHPVNPHDLTRDEEKAWALGLYQYTTSTHVAMDARKTLESSAEDLYEALELLIAPAHLPGCLSLEKRGLPCQCGSRERKLDAYSKASAALAKARGEKS